MAKTTRKRTTSDRLIAIATEVSIKAAEGDNPKTPPTFEATVYTGRPIVVANYDAPVVIDLAGLQSKNNIVANLDHDPSQRVGKVTSRSDEGGRLVLSGLANAATAARDEVVLSARDGFTWEASIEASPIEIDEVDAGDTVRVNGQDVTGPVYLVKAAKLTGFAFVSHGADDATEVSIAASRSQTRGSAMDKHVKNWIEKDLGLVIADLSADQLANLEANYRGENGPTPKPAKTSKNVFAREKEKREHAARIEAVAETVIRENPAAGADFVETVEAMATEAIENNEDVRDFELALLRATRPEPATPFRGNRSSMPGARTIEAALAITGGLPNVDKHFSDQDLELADRQFPRGIGLKELFLICARANGYHSSSLDVNQECLRAAFSPIRGSGFSTLSIPGILSNTANKFLADGWNAVDSTWSRICRISSVRDFKTRTSYSMTGGFEYQKVGPGGEIAHATVGEETYTIKADTYGRMMAITRTDLINDDLGALTEVPRKLGRGAALKLNSVFWTSFLNNSDFFKTANANVSTGGGSVLSLAGITAAEVVFLNQTDPDGYPLGIMPEILLVPPTLKATGATLMRSQNIIDGTATAAQGGGNIWQGRFRLESSPYMENANYTGYSAAAWYLLANPADQAVIEVAFLNGRQVPVIETAEADFSSLGVQMRGYHDFGVSLWEPRGGVRSAGS